jgi:hypothetical protein
MFQSNCIGICTVYKQCTLTDNGTQVSMLNYLSYSLAVRYGITIKKISNIGNVGTGIDFKIFFVRISGYVIQNYGPGRPI